METFIVFKAVVSRILPNWLKLRMNTQNVKRRYWQQANTKKAQMDWKTDKNGLKLRVFENLLA